MTALKKENLTAGLFGGPQSELNEFFGITGKPMSDSVTWIPIGKLRPSPKNPFLVLHDEAMEELIASIKSKGILVPLIVRPAGDDEYETIAGHRRFFGSKAAGLTELPCVIKELTDEEADIIMVDSNLNRPHIRTSEKAFAYKLKYEAIKRKAGRNWDKQQKEINTKSNWAPGAQLETSARNQREPGSLWSADSNASAEIIAKEMGVASRTIKNYLRLTRLDHTLLSLVDEKELPLKAGVQLSYLPLTVQGHVHGAMAVEDIKVGEDMAKALRAEFEHKENVTIDDVLRIMRPQPQPQKLKPKKLAVKLNPTIKKEYFPKNYDDEKIEVVVKDLLDLWAKNHNPEYPAYQKK